MKQCNNAAVSISVLLALAGVSVFGGCDRRTDNVRTIEGSASQLNAMGGVNSETSVPFADERVASATTGISGVVSSGTGDEKGSASWLLAEAQLAQGESLMGFASDPRNAKDEKSLSANELELQSRNLIMRISSAAADWAQRSAVAAAAESFSASKDLKALADSKAEKTTEIAAERSRQQQVQQSVDALRAQAKTKIDAADAKSAEYGRMVQDAAKLSATEAAGVIDRANAIRREGDAIRAEGLKIQAQADEQAPLVNEIGLMVDKLDKQLKNIDATTEALKKRESGAKAEASQSREAADKAATDVDKLVVELAQLRDGPVNAVYTKAIDLFTKASSSANAAAGASSSGGKATLGSAKMSLAEAQWSKAQGARAFATTLNSLASIKPKLQNADDYKNKAEAARKQAEDSIKEAIAAFESAKTAFDGVRVQRADVKERFTKLSEDLEKKTKNVVDGIWLDLKAQASTPEDTLNRYIAAVRDHKFETVTEMTQWPDEASKGVMIKMMDFSKAIMDADSASMAKFNQPMDKLLSSNPMLGMMMTQFGAAKEKVAKISSLSASDFQMAPQGEDHITATPPAGGENVYLVKVDGQWKVTLGPEEAAQIPMAAAMVGKLTPLKDVFAQWAADVNAGKFADGAAAAADFSAKIMPALQGMMGKGGGGG